MYLTEDLCFCNTCHTYNVAHRNLAVHKFVNLALLFHAITLFVCDITRKNKKSSMVDHCPLANKICISDRRETLIDK